MNGWKLANYIKRADAQFQIAQEWSMQSAPTQNMEK